MPSRAVRVASIYLPNGNPPGTDKYVYKLAWMGRLRERVRALLALEEPMIIAGDFNVIPAPEDVYNPSAWREDALFRPETRAAFQSLVNLGLTDAFRACNATPHQYSFWEYQAGAGVNAPAVSYMVGGKQYVAVAAGGGGGALTWGSGAVQAVRATRANAPFGGAS